MSSTPSLQDIAAELSDLTARIDKAELEIASLKLRADNAEARLVEADKRTTKVETENADLKAEVEALKVKLEPKSNGPDHHPADEGELMMKYDSRWRAMEGKVVCWNLWVGGWNASIILWSSIDIYGREQRR